MTLIETHLHFREVIESAAGNCCWVEAQKCMAEVPAVVILVAVVDEAVEVTSLAVEAVYSWPFEPVGPSFEDPETVESPSSSS